MIAISIAQFRVDCKGAPKRLRLFGEGRGLCPLHPHQENFLKKFSWNFQKPWMAKGEALGDALELFGDGGNAVGVVLLFGVLLVEGLEKSEGFLEI